MLPRLMTSVLQRSWLTSSHSSAKRSTSFLRSRSASFDPGKVGIPRPPCRTRSRWNTTWRTYPVYLHNLRTTQPQCIRRAAARRQGAERFVFMPGRSR